MYETDYFVRFVLSPPQARRDLRRGYSFSGYIFHKSLAEAMDFWSDFRPVDRSDFGRCDQGWGLKLDGLCGFGPFETIEEAEEVASENRGYGDGTGYWPMAAIYIGTYVGQADGGDGDMFRPSKLIKIIEFQKISKGG